MLRALHTASLAAVLVLAVGLAGARAQTTTSPPPGNLATQTTHAAGGAQGSGKGAPTVQAAPREAVHPAGGGKTPVVQSHGQTHAQPHAQKPKAKPAAPAPAPAAAPAPASEPAAPAPAEAPIKGSATGNPLPRFAALRTDEVNLRRGPGTRYPIDWVYKRRDLPVEIEREFEVWRLIVDPDGVKGWVHQATLTGRRSFMVTGADRTLRRDADDTSAAVAILKPGVIGHIRSCDAGSDWCQVQVASYRGYLKRDQLWGVLPGEAVSD